MKKFELRQQDLELVVSEKTLGALTTNAKDIKTAIEKALPNYDINNYDETNIDQATKDKALLNKTSKALNDKRILTEKEFMKPFEEFKKVVNDTIDLIKKASSKIDVVVQEEIIKTKEIKKVAIQAFWDSTKFKLVTLDKIFNEKWLNKGTKHNDITDEIVCKQTEILDSLRTIEAIGEDMETLKALYLDSLNLNNAIKYGKILKENREKATKEAEKRAEAKRISDEMAAERKAKAEARFKEKATELPRFEPTAKVNSYTEVMPTKAPAPAFKIEESLLLVRIMRVTTTKENIIKLGDFMNENGIKFEKVKL